MLSKILPAGRHRPIDFSTLTMRGRPNQFLIAPAGFCPGPAHEESPVFDLPVADLAGRFHDQATATPRIEERARSDDRLQFDYVARSKLIGYPDWITVRFIPLDDGRSTLAVYSRSVYGRRDFGVNRRRITDWLGALGKA